MDLESCLVDVLYKKIGGCSLREDIYLPNGAVLICGRVRKSHIRKAIQQGAASILLDLLIADPARLGNYGTKHVRDGMSALVKSPPTNVESLVEAISQLLRNNENA